MKAERKMHMHESMIPKADKKSSKESPTLEIGRASCRERVCT